LWGHGFRPCWPLPPTPGFLAARSPARRPRGIGALHGVRVPPGSSHSSALGRYARRHGVTNSNRPSVRSPTRALRGGRSLHPRRPALVRQRPLASLRGDNAPPAASCVTLDSVQSEGDSPPNRQGASVRSRGMGCTLPAVPRPVPCPSSSPSGATLPRCPPSEAPHASPTISPHPAHPPRPVVIPPSVRPGAQTVLPPSVPPHPCRGGGRRRPAADPPPPSLRHASARRTPG